MISKEKDHTISAVVITFAICLVAYLLYFHPQTEKETLIKVCQRLAWVASSEPVSEELKQNPFLPDVEKHWEGVQANTLKTVYQDCISEGKATLDSKGK